MADREHKDKIVFWAHNKDSKVWVTNAVYGVWIHTKYPYWRYDCSYVITNSTFEENLFKAWWEGKTLEFLDPTCEYEDKWVELPKEAIPEFHKYTYRLKVEKSPYDLAKEEADTQKENSGPIDIYKWHWGTGNSFSLENEEVWDYGYYSKHNEKGIFYKKQGRILEYVSHQLYKKRP